MDLSNPDQGGGGGGGGLGGEELSRTCIVVSWFFDQTRCGHTRFDGFHIKEGGVNDRRRQRLDINMQSHIRLEICKESFLRWEMVDVAG